MSFSPNRHLIPALTGEWLHIVAVGQHREYLHLAASPVGCKNQVPSVWSPIGIFVATRSMRQLTELSAGHVHQENIEITGLETSRPGERDDLSIRMPGRVRRVAFSGSQHLRIGAVPAHSPDLLRSGA